MNYQETPKQACHCCEECIQVQNERFTRSYDYGYQKPQTPTSRKNENYNEGYYKSEKHSSGGYSQSYNSKYSDKKQSVDANTLKALSNLRKRACKFLETSEETRTPEDDDYKPCIRVKESHPYEGHIRNKAEEIDYEPESYFLRKMKLRNEMKTTESDVYSPQMTYDTSSYLREEQPNCVTDDVQFHFKQSTFPNVESLPNNKLNVNERGTQYCDMTAPKDLCTCYKSWRTKYSENEGLNEFDLLDEYSEICRQLTELQDNLEDSSKIKDEREEKHVKRRSRSTTRQRRMVRRRRSRISRKSNLESENSFQPSLKKPHPGACDRCWRYASPSRSPVNKPSQRFDPNFRRSHSDIFLNGKGETKGERKIWETPRQKTDNSSPEGETKVHQLISPGSQLDSPLIRSSHRSATLPERTKRSVDVKKRPSGSAKDGEKERLNDIRGKKNQLRGDRRSLSVNFDERFDRKGKSSKSSPPVTSGRRLSKSVKKAPDSNQPPKISETASGKETKSKIAVADQMSPSNVKLEKVTTQSVDREQVSPCSKNALGDMSPNQIPTKSPQTISSLQRPNFSHKPKKTLDTSPGGLQARPETATSSLHKTSNCREEEKRLGLTHSLDSPSRRGNHPCSTCQFHRSTSQNLSSREHENKYGGNVPQEKRKCICKNLRQEKSANIKRDSSEVQNNPRKYCVFYMNKAQQNNADDIEVLIEELTQGKDCKDSEESLKEKMSKIKEVKGDSMALRFQKGVSHNCRRPESNRVLYF